jgi:hypothetical protein
MELPLWLKRAAVEHAQNRGQNLTDLVKELLRRETGAVRPESKRRK